MSAEFKDLSTSERAKWDKLAAEDKERYQAAMEDYEPPEDDDSPKAKKGAAKKKAAPAPKASPKKMPAKGKAKK
jgi:structure-specific recognition protein 1